MVATMDTSMMGGTHVEPLYIKDADMPVRNINPVVVVKAFIRVVSSSYLDGVQKIGNSWRVYLKNISKRVDVMIKRTIVICGVHVPLYDQDPFAFQQNSHKNDKLTIKGLPLPINNEEIVQFLKNNNIVLSSTVRFGLIREEDGTLTSFKNGDRFVYVQPFDPPMSRQQTIAGFKCAVIHHGKGQNQCKSCNQNGHKVGDSACPAKAEEGSILAFRGYQHPLSNHFLTPIIAFDQDKEFKSVEHAFFWKMAHDLGHSELASQIRDAKHAGIVKRLSKDMTEAEREKWEDENTEVMIDLLDIKAQSCKAFRNCLIENQSKIIAEATPNSRWATGLSAYVSERTKPEYWPGRNILGMMMMDITGEQLEEYAKNDAIDDMDYDHQDRDEANPIQIQVDDIQIPITAFLNQKVTESSKSSQEGADDTTLNQAHLDNKQQEAARADLKSPRTPMRSDNKQQEAARAVPKSPRTPTRRDNKQQEAARADPKGPHTPMHQVNKPTPPSSQSSKDRQSRSVTRKGAKDRTAPKRDIRTYFDPDTGKRKQPESTPEKNDNAKKQATRDHK